MSLGGLVGVASFAISSVEINILIVAFFAFFIGSNVNAQETEVIIPEVTKTTVKSRQKVNTDDVIELEEITVKSNRRKDNLLGMTGSASQGKVDQAQFEYRPLSRNGELVEVIP